MQTLTKLTTLVIPLSPTDNSLRQPVIMRGHPQLVPTNEYTQWKKQADKAVMLWRLSNPGFTQYKPSKKEFMFFEYRLFMASWRTDPSNFNKALQDRLTSDKGCDNKLFNNDRYVSLRLILETPKIDSFNPRFEINPIPLCCLE